MWENSSHFRSCSGSVQRPFISIDDRKKARGKKGKPIKLLTNHFNMEIKQSQVHIYSIALKFPWKCIRKKDKPLHFRCVEKIKEIHCGKVYADLKHSYQQT